MKKTVAAILIPYVGLNPASELNKTFMQKKAPIEIVRPQKINNEILTKTQVLDAEYKAYLAEQKRIRIEEEKKKIEEEKARIAEQNRKNNVNFNYYNLLEPSGITHSEMYNILADTGLADVAWTIAQCEIDFGVNALVLAALLAEESWWGNSNRAKTQNNLSGFEVFDDYAVGAIFETRSASVVETARLLSQDYLTEGGKYYNGYSLNDVNTLYSANPNWNKNINNIAKELVEKYRKICL